MEDAGVLGMGSFHQSFHLAYLAWAEGRRSCKRARGQRGSTRRPIFGRARCSDLLRPRVAHVKVWFAGARIFSGMQCTLGIGVCSGQACAQGAENLSRRGELSRG